LTNKIILGILSLLFGFFALGLGFYLTYLTLRHIAATELMWFVFWLYIPFTIILTIVGKLVESME